MKKIILPCLLLLAGQAFAQHYIDIDNIDQKHALRVKFRTPVYFRFKNVNPLYLDSITLTATTFNFSGDVPDIFSSADAGKAVKQPNQKINDAESIEDGRSQKDSLRAVIQNLTLQENLKKEFVKQYTKFKQALENLSLTAQLEEYIIQQLKKEGVIIRNPTVLKSNLTSYFKSINNKSENDDDFRNNIFTKLQEVNESYAELSRLYDELGKTLAEEKISLSGKLSDNEKEITFSIKDAPVSLDRKKFFAAEFAFAKQRMELINKDSVRNALIHSINRGADLYKKITNNDFVKIDGPHFITSDQATFTPKIKNEKGQVIKEFDIPVQAKGGVKVDFSSGYLLSFRGDEEYRTVYDTAGKATGIKASNKQHLTHALGALMNVYVRSANGVSFGGSFGISIPVEGSLNFYLGASLLALEKNRLVLTAGVSWVKVKLLNTANVEVKGNQYVFNSSIREPQYDERYRPAAFVGVTYNIFSLSGDKKN